MNFTLKEIISSFKNRDIEYDLNTEIKVLITSTHCEGKRKTIFIDPESNAFIDRIAMIGFENCTVSDTKYVKLTGKDRLLIVIIDLDRQ